MVFNEALSIPLLDHSLNNPSQLRHNHTKVQDNPFCEKPMHIDSPEADIVACLQREGTCIFLDKWAPYHRKLETLTHVVLTLSYTRVTQNVKFPEFDDSAQEEVEMKSVASVASHQSNLTFGFLDCNNCRELNDFCDIKSCQTTHQVKMMC